MRHPAVLGVLEGDGDPLFGTALSPGGRILAAGDEDGTIHLIDTRTRQRIGAPLQLEGDAGSLDFSPDGSVLAVAGQPGETAGSRRVKLVDVATRKVVHEIAVGFAPPDPERLTTIDARFAEDGALLVGVSENWPAWPHPPYLRRYDPRTGEPLGPAVRLGSRSGIPARTVPARRDFLLYSGPDTISIVDAKTLRVRRRIPAGSWSAAVSPDGRSAALGQEDGSVSFVDLRTGERRPLSGRHEDRVHQEAFSPDGRTLVTTADDGRVLVWDLRSGAVRETLTGQTGPITSIRISDDGRTLYTVGLHGRIYIWDIAADRRLGRGFQAHPLVPSGRSDHPPPLAVSPSGRTVATGLPEGGVRLHDAHSLRRLRDLPRLGGGPVRAVEFSPDGRTIAATGEGGAVEFRDPDTGRRVRPPLSGLRAPAEAMAFSADGERVAVADLEGNLRMLEIRSGRVRRAQRPGSFPVHLSFSPDGGTLAIGLGEAGTELRDGRSLRVLARLRNRRRDADRWVQFSPDGRLLAISSFGYTQLWDAESRRPVGAPLGGHEGDVFNAEFSPDGEMLATSGFDGSVILWDVDSRRTLGALPGSLGFTSARFTPDGRRLFKLLETGAAQRWEVSLDAWSRHACAVAGRELTRAEWQEFVPDQDYRRVCSF